MSTALSGKKSVELEQATFVIFDVETTGIDPSSGHRLCEIAAIKIRRGKEAERFHQLVNPQRSNAAFEKNRISDEELRPQPPFEQVAPVILDFLRGSILVAQNASFDMGFLNSEFKRLGHTLPERPVLDTISLARFVAPELSSYSLDSLARRFNLTFRERHRAMGDTEVTAQLFLLLLERLQQRGIKTLERLLEIGKPK